MILTFEKRSQKILILKKVLNLEISCKFARRKLRKRFLLLDLQNLSFKVGYFYIACVDVSQHYSGTCDLVENSFENCWKSIGTFCEFFWKFIQR